MAAKPEPATGAWYETEEGQTFMVLAVNKPKGVIDIQYINGQPDTLDFDIWLQMQLQEIEPPQDWHGSMDELKWPDAEIFPPEFVETSD